MTLKSRKPGKEIKTYEEFVKLNPKIFYLEKFTEYTWDQQVIEVGTIQDEHHFNLIVAGPYKIYEVIEEYYPDEIVEFAGRLQSLRDDYDEDLDIFENAERLFNTGYRIEK